jgi:hypothetical protein
MKNRLCLCLGSCFLFAAAACSAQTPEQQQICDHAQPLAVGGFCKRLSDEFAQKRIASGTYPLNNALYIPTNDAAQFAGTLRKRAYVHVMANTMKADAKTGGQKDAQVIANELAQLVSTKAAVPQPGASSSGSGSTTLTAKPTTTDLISLAAESGALTDTVNGNTITAQANVNGLRRYITDRPFASLKPSNLEDHLQHITLSATFNLAQSSSGAAPTTGQATSTTPAGIASVLLPSNSVSFNGLGISVAILRPYTPTSAAFNKAWTSALAEEANSPNTEAQQLFTDYTKAIPAGIYTSNPKVSAALEKWQKDAAQDEASSDPDAFAHFANNFATYMDALAGALESNPDFDQNIVNTAIDLDQLHQLRDKIIDEARGKPLLTFNYNYVTPTNEPAMHNATAVFAYVWKKRDDGAQLTGNAAGSWFASVPAGAKYGRVKDYQLTAEFDQPVGKDPAAPRAIASLAGYAQYQYSPNVLNLTVANVIPGTNIAVPANSQVFTSTAGWLGVAQAKLVFNIGKGATVPVAVKWSNKTDLLAASDWKGQFGISYDLSALKSILLGKAQ